MSQGPLRLVNSRAFVLCSVEVTSQFCEGSLWLVDPRVTCALLFSRTLVVFSKIVHCACRVTCHWCFAVFTYFGGIFKNCSLCLSSYVSLVLCGFLWLSKYSHCSQWLIHPHVICASSHFESLPARDTGASLFWVTASCHDVRRSPLDCVSSWRFFYDFLGNEGYLSQRHDFCGVLFWKTATLEKVLISMTTHLADHWNITRVLRERMDTNL